MTPNGEKIITANGQLDEEKLKQIKLGNQKTQNKMKWHHVLKKKKEIEIKI